jgi:ankyrin repeat protein
MTFPQVLKKIWYMDNSDLNVVGEHLGYKWNQVCNAVSEAEFYAEDGDGTFSVDREDDNDYSDNEIINKIMTAIFENYPKVNEIRISN